MADINGRPFLQYLLDFVSSQGIKEVILAVGYKWEIIRDFFGEKYNGLTIQYSVEDTPLGTGGAILKAVNSSAEEEFFVLNGDTFFAIDLSLFYHKHIQLETDLSITLRRMVNFDRYGVVITDKNSRIKAFEEKKWYAEGNINAGIYLLRRNLFKSLTTSTSFSFEKDLMERYCGRYNFYGINFENYFIDIGIPEDYERAKRELAQFTH